MNREFLQLWICHGTFDTQTFDGAKSKVEAEFDFVVDSASLCVRGCSSLRSPSPSISQSLRIGVEDSHLNYRRRRNLEFSDSGEFHLAMRMGTLLFGKIKEDVTGMTIFLHLDPAMYAFLNKLRSFLRRPNLTRETKSESRLSDSILEKSSAVRGKGHVSEMTV